MPTYQFKIKLQDRPNGELEHQPNREPTLDEMADVILTGLIDEFGPDFEVSVYDGQRPDR